MAFSKVCCSAAGRRCVGLVGALAGAVFAGGSAHALTIIPVFDSTITTLSDASAVEGAIDAAIGTFERSFTANVDIEIQFSWGKVDGYTVASGNAAESISYIFSGYSYAQIASYLGAAAKANPTDTVLGSAVASLPATDPLSAKNFAVTMADAQALGLEPPTAIGVDGFVGFSSKLTYNLNPDTPTLAGQYDLEALAEHEMSEVMGRISGLTSSNPTMALPFDLLRYSAPGVHAFGYSTAAYFSVDGGVTKLAEFNISGGGDRGDWTGLTDAFNATAAVGKDLTFGTADLAALDALGWDAASNPQGWSVAGVTKGTPGLMGDVPEPSTWTLCILGSGLAGGSLRRRRAAFARTA